MNLLINRHSGFKKVMCFTLMFLVMVMTLFVQFVEVQAFAFVVPLIGIGLVAAAGLLIAAGLTFPTTYSAEQASTNWFQGLCNDRENGVAGAAEAFNKFVEFYENTSSVKIIDDVLWSHVRNYVNSKYNTGTNPVTQANNQIKTSDLNYYFTLDSDSVGMRYNAVNFKMSTTQTDNYEWQAGTLYGNYQNWKIIKNGVVWSAVPNGFDCKLGTTPCFYLYSDTSNLMHLECKYWYYTSSSEANIYPAISGMYVTEISNARIEKSQNVNASITGQETAIDNSTYDFPKTVAGDRAVTVPTTLEGEVGLTYNDVVAQDTPIDVPITNTDGEINWEPLKVVGTLFTNRFPFSLPWDLLRSFTSLAGSSGKPDFSIAVPDTKLLKGFAFNIDLTMFEDLIQVSKALELLAFDIGLILITRKLLGGAV